MVPVTDPEKAMEVVLPEQIICDVGVAVTVGVGLTITEVDIDVEQLFKSVTVKL